MLSAWYDAQGNEVADLQRGGWNPNAFLPVDGGSASSGTLYDQTIDSVRYYLQSVWSNEANGCELMSSLQLTIAGLQARVQSGTSLALSASAGTGASIQSYTWSFGDGQSASGQSVSHVYGTPGDYTVGLTVTDAFGNTGSTADQVAVVDTPGTTAGASGVSGRRSGRRSRAADRSAMARTGARVTDDDHVCRSRRLANPHAAAAHLSRGARASRAASGRASAAHGPSAPRRRRLA